MSSRYEQLRIALTKAALSNDVTVKGAALSSSAADGYLDGLSEAEVYRLKTIRSDLLLKQTQTTPT